MKFRELTLQYRALPAIEPRPQVLSPTGAAAILRPFLEDEPSEVFSVLLVDAKHRTIDYHVVSRGIVDRCEVSPAVVFRAAIAGNAPALLLAHNHLSGDPTPSPDDAALTERLRAGAALLGLQILDHVIIGEAGRYYSFQEAGRL